MVVQTYLDNVSALENNSADSFKSTNFQEDLLSYKTLERFTSRRGEGGIQISIKKVLLTLIRGIRALGLIIL